ncbi:MAG: 3-oxo-tetronate kinase, partial [Alphaproteobacteria bacterium]
MLLGCIGDDFTGSSDLANTLAKGGMQVALFSGVPDGPSSAEAGVVALKSRTIAPKAAVAQSLAALEWLLAQGCRQIFFKYCSTFDSTLQGNIGPVADALADRLGESAVIVCPAFPAAGRTVYQGHLFVNGQPLHESGMQNHPLTPMTDSDLRRWLEPQTQRVVEHIPAECVMQGAGAIAQALGAVTSASLMVVDAITDADLLEIGKAAKGRKLITGGSGVALGLPANFGLTEGQARWSGVQGAGAILSGSCSAATRGQVLAYAENHPTFEIHADQVMSNSVTAESIARWMLDNIDASPLAYSSADPTTVAAAQTKYGGDIVTTKIESIFASIARLLIAG